MTLHATPLERLVMRHEGFRSHVYRCTAGALTIGFGTNISDGISQDEAHLLLRHRLQLVVSGLEHRFAWWPHLTPARQQVLASMGYQLGLPGLLRFRRMLLACGRGDYPEGAREMLDSKWAREDSPNRARELAEMMRRG